MARLFVIGVFCFLATHCFGQRIDPMKEVNGIKSKITDNKNIGIMDTVLFLVRGQITKRQDIDEKDLKGINVTLKNVNGGQISSAATDGKGNFKIWGDRGTYDLEISCFGLDKIVVNRLRIGSGEIRLINVILGPGTYYEMTEK